MACMLEPAFFSQIPPRCLAFHLEMSVSRQRKELATLPYVPMAQDKVSSLTDIPYVQRILELSF